MIGALSLSPKNLYGSTTYTEYDNSIYRTSIASRDKNDVLFTSIPAIVFRFIQLLITVQFSLSLFNCNSPTKVAVQKKLNYLTKLN